MLQRAGASSGPSSELRRLVEEEDGARSDVAALLHDGENALEASTTEGVTRGSAGREPGLSAGEMDEESLLGTESRNNRAQDSSKCLGPCSGNVSATAVGFWLLGLMNNATFVIMNAGAKEIFAEGVGGVYLANVLPSLFVKASAPFWFHLVPYHVRITLCAALTVACLSTVALGQSLGVQLFGVAVGAFAGSLGEASFLAYSAFFDGPTALTACSGTLLRLSKRDLWLMPVLQMVLLVFFTANGVWHFWWNQSLLALAFVVGLLGGAVYVHGYILISREVAPERKEFALASASLADTLGIMLANMTGIIIQGCLYAVNDLTDEGRAPAFTCGKNYD
ncbi:Protein BTN1 [Hondaea fermentalgiana]|uniref:Protein BTN1 n=1 Tax=Hondaea fermentalgiana TaxID=2315210 RepID=A0A2R5GG36_9STRA|nr:Protein BTN1 [Hondaea fermentalgiana]|eukprot:GBG29840.1 Protein BTN1 [Hondaea fermentalgiana]